MSLTNAGERLLAEIFFRGGTRPSKFYIGLATGTIDENSTLATISEISDSGYSRQEITFGEPVTDDNGTTWIANDSTIQFGPFTSNHTVTYGFITDVPSGTDGTLILYSAAEEQKTVASGDYLIIPAGKQRYAID